jgi:hypothetical protein
MSSPYPHLGDRVGWGHPSVLGQRARERLLVGLSALVALALALAVSLEIPQPSLGSLLAVLGITLGVVGVFALMLSTRYEVTLTVLALYLGLLDGPVKLESASSLASAGRDVLIAAIGLGMLARLALKRERITLPPLSGWPLIFVVVVLIEALNPYTAGVLKIIGGYRQELEFVPFFFFGYLIIRSKQRFRQLFLLFGVIALANGLVGAYQSRLTPGQLASWGPGYSIREEGNGQGLTGRTYSVEGVSHPRPLALGSDAGAGGVVGIIALPGLLALLVAGETRRRWPVALCCLGALLAIATAASRTFAVVAVVELVAFVALAMIAGLRMRRALVGLLVGLVLAGGVGVALVAADGSQIFRREESLVSPRVKEGTGLEVEEETGGDAKTRNISEIPRDLVDAPFGLGLGITGAASGFGGHVKVRLEEEKVSGASAYNLLAVETGALGLFLWLGLSVSVIGLGITRLRRIRDRDLRLYLVAILTTFVALAIQGFSAPTLAVSPAGVFQWFAPGVLAFWLAGPGRAAMRASPRALVTAAKTAPSTATA